MTPDLIMTIIVALIGAVGGGIGVAWLNRDKTRAEAAGALTEGTIKLLNELQEERAADRRTMEGQRERIDGFDATLTEIRWIYDDQIEQLKAELNIQASAIENLNAENLKLQMIIQIYVQQLRERGIEPVVEPGNLSGLTIKQLRRVLDGYSNINRRREKRGQETDD